MKANLAYFHRNRGQWSWEVRFELKSWSGLWKADTSFFNKASLSFAVLAQRVFGPFQMWTNVVLAGPGSLVHHSTRMKKWGVTIYRSEKNFHLSDDGHSIRLEGDEYFWPLSFLAVPFKSTEGSVDPSTTRATYQMPIAGALCSCQAYMELPVGHMDLATPWFQAHLTLTAASNKFLESRFQER